jgi:hypothetical protein
MRSAPSLWWRLVRFGFRLLYNEFAFSYDLVSKVVSLGAWRCWQQSALKHLNDDGCSANCRIAGFSDAIRVGIAPDRHRYPLIVCGVLAGFHAGLEAYVPDVQAVGVW